MRQIESDPDYDLLHREPALASRQSKMQRTKIMKRFIASFTGALALGVIISGCASMTGSAGVNWSAMNPGPLPDRAIAMEEAKNAIKRRLKDPDSLQFRDSTPFFKTLYNFGLGAVGSYEPLWAMCFEVNAKNSYGGYTGFQHWLVKFRNGHVVSGDLGVITNAAYDCTTGPNQQDRLSK